MNDAAEDIRCNDDNVVDTGSVEGLVRRMELLQQYALMVGKLLMLQVFPNTAKVV